MEGGVGRTKPRSHSRPLAFVVMLAGAMPILRQRIQATVPFKSDRQTGIRRNGRLKHHYKQTKFSKIRDLYAPDIVLSEIRSWRSVRSILPEDHDSWLPLQYNYFFRTQRQTPPIQRCNQQAISTTGVSLPNRHSDRRESRLQ